MADKVRVKPLRGASIGLNDQGGFDVSNWHIDPVPNGTATDLVAAVLDYLTAELEKQRTTHDGTKDT